MLAFIHPLGYSNWGRGQCHSVGQLFLTAACLLSGSEALLLLFLVMKPVRQCFQKLKLRQLLPLVDDARESPPWQRALGGHRDEGSPWGRSEHSSAMCVLPSLMATWSCLHHPAQHGSVPYAVNKIPDTVEECEGMLHWLKVLYCRWT